MGEPTSLPRPEEMKGSAYRDFVDAQSRLARFIEEVYNCQRLHSAVAYATPEEFENAQPRQRAAAQQSADASLDTCP